MIIAKKSLLRPIGVRNPRKEISDLELELLNKINKLGIGVMGLGAGPTALDVHIELAARHPASLPVAVVFSCWALRHATVEIDRNWNAKYL